ncbi:MAG: hypothetical protein Q7S17_06560 [Xanthobacteraceae bacterium]|nr:hypothetical protein [Xanthobacteraceae bacterium]
MMHPDKKQLEDAAMGRKVVKLPTAEEPALTKFDRDVAELLLWLAADLDFLSRELPPATDRDYEHRRRVLLVDLHMRARIVAKRIISLRE